MGEFNDGYCNYCKKCCEKILRKYLKDGNSMSKAIYLTCKIIDLPYVREIANRVEDNRYTMARYVSDLKNIIMFGIETTYTDFNSSDDFVDGKNYIREQPVTGEIRTEEKERVKNWGIQESEKDYEFLDYTFKRYTEDISEFANAQQEDLYRDLCLLRLILRKMNDGTYNGEENIDKVQTRITKLMSILKIDDYSNNSPKTLSEKSLFEKIRLCEEKTWEEVYKEPDKKYKDLNKIQEYLEKFSLRPLLNTLVGHRDFDIDLDDIDRYDSLND